MPVNATALSISALKPRDEEYEVAVAQHRGLVVTVYPSGARFFSLRYRQDGVLKRVSLGVGSLSEARSAWLKHREDLKRGKDPVAMIRASRVEKQLNRQAERSSPTVEMLSADFIRLYAKRHKKSWRSDELMLNSLVIPEWGGIQAKDIRRRDIIDLLDEIAGRTPVRANRVLAVIRKMFAWAVERDTLEISPCAGVKRPAKESSRTRVLSDEEIRQFWAHLSDQTVSLRIATALKLQLATAQRIGEVAGTRWSEFNLQKREWRIPGSRTKNGRENVVPLSSLACALILEMHTDENEFLFPSGGKVGHLRIDVVTHGLVDLVAKSKLAHFTSHDLRRTTATRLASMGTARVIVDAILNHKDSSVGAIYDRYDYASEKREALEKWADRLRDIIKT
jgi:integrase